jgi:hypothetical protein
LTREIKKVKNQIDALLDPELGYTETSLEIVKLRDKIATLEKQKLEL